MRRQRPRELDGILALVLAGGLGTRLRTAYAEGPKSLAPVMGRPFLDHLLDWLHFSGITDVVLCVGYKAELIRERYQSEFTTGVRISYSEEREPLGTGGAIKNAEALVHSDTFLVLNGDSFADVCLRRLIRFHRQRKALATLTLAPRPKDLRYGSVRVNTRREVQGFLEKRASGARDGKRAQTWINSGIYAFQKEFLSMIPRGRVVSLETEIFPRLVGNRFYGFPARGYFIDIGVPADYRQAQHDFRERLLQ
jgi:NDP-sugar pyrophosphorylase family protein